MRSTRAQKPDFKLEKPPTGVGDSGPTPRCLPPSAIGAGRSLSTHVRRPRAVTLLVCIVAAPSIALLLLLLAPAGCTSSLSTARRWTVGNRAADYQTAERLAAESRTGILVYYTKTDLTRDDPIRDRLTLAASQSDKADYVRCTLFRDHEPDRRYVAQYGVFRAPAIIAIHSDGTYHACDADMSEDGIGRFLASATMPGDPPKYNPLIPREPIYNWTSDADAAMQAGATTRRPVLFVLDRWMTREWRKLRGLLERREVFTRFADMIHCRPTSALSPSGAVAKRFGVNNLPALVVVDADGQPHVLELPSSYEAIVRFADTIGSKASASTSLGSASPVPAATSAPAVD